MKLEKILFSLVLLFSFNAEAKFISYYNEILNTVKLYCRPDQYFNPKSKALLGSVLELPVIGICETDRESFFKIYFDNAYWDSASEDYRYELMAHEIMHCFFFMDHVRDNKNFMYPEIRDLNKQETKQQLIQHLQVLCK